MSITQMYQNQENVNMNNRRHTEPAIKFAGADLSPGVVPTEPGPSPASLSPFDKSDKNRDSDPRSPGSIQSPGQSAPNGTHLQVPNPSTNTSSASYSVPI